jgi:hypothetical protein
MLHGRKKPNKKRGAHSISQNGFFDVAYQPVYFGQTRRRGCEQRVENRDIRVPTAKLRPIHINGNAKVRCNNKLIVQRSSHGGKGVARPSPRLGGHIINFAWRSYYNYMVINIMRAESKCA